MNTKRLILFLTIIIFAFSIVFLLFSVKHDLPQIRIILKEGTTLEEINSGSKDTKYGDNTVILVGVDGKREEYSDVELKGRGNFTWLCCDKKSYQLKFNEAVSVFGMDQAKKWVCTSNNGDVSLIRNKLAYDLAKKIHLLAPDSMFVDFYVNDEYIGNYLLSEKNQVGAGRVELQDEYGVLCEVDANYGKNEDYVFRTYINQNLIVLSDSVADDLDEEDSVALAAFRLFENKLNIFESLLYSSDASWEDISAMIDVDSFIEYYFIQELCEDSDGCRSSMYLYSDGANDVIHLGPVWDFDIAFGQFITEERGADPQIDYTVSIQQYYSKSVDWFRILFQYDEFSKLAVEMYNNTIKPVFMSIPELVADYQRIPGFQKSVKMNFRKWPDLLGNESIYGNTAHRYRSTYKEEVDYLLEWIDSRVQFLNARYCPDSSFSTFEVA